MIAVAIEIATKIMPLRYWVILGGIIAIGLIAFTALKVHDAGVRSSVTTEINKANDDALVTGTNGKNNALDRYDACVRRVPPGTWDRANLMCH